VDEVTEEDAMTLSGKVAVVTGVTGPLGEAIDLAPHGITVNVVAPGVVESRCVRENLTALQIERRLERNPMSRLASPEDIAAGVAHLASPDMDYATGQILYVDRGFCSAGIITR